MIEADANSMLGFPLISGIVISDYEDRLLFSGFHDTKNRPQRELEGDGNGGFENGELLSHRFSVFFSDTHFDDDAQDDEIIGYVTLFTSKGMALTRIRRRVFLIILTACIKFAALWIIFLQVSGGCSRNI